MISPIIIKPFSPAFADQIFELILPIQGEEFGVKITRADQPDLAAIPDFYQSGNGNFWIAIAKNRVVGTIGLKDIGDGQFALRKMFVAAAYRGKETGVAKALLETAREWVKTRRGRDVFLGTTDKFLAAHRFYEKHGFTEVAKTTLPPRFPVMAVDSKFYHLPCEEKKSAA